MGFDSPDLASHWFGVMELMRVEGSQSGPHQHSTRKMTGVPSTKFMKHTT